MTRSIGRKGAAGRAGGAPWAPLGAVGGWILAEVLVGLLQRDRNSYLYLNPSFKPAPPVAPAIGQFTTVDLLTFARVWT